MKVQLLTTILFFSLNFAVSASITDNFRNRRTHESRDTVQWGMEYLKQFTEGQEQWFFYNSEFKKSVNGLLHFVEDEPIDTIFFKIEKYKGDSLLVFRRWQDVSDTLSVPGYLTKEQIIEKMKQLDREIRDQNPLDKIPIPEYLLSGLEQKVPFIRKENVQVLIDRKFIVLPDSLNNLVAKKDTLKPGRKKYARYQQLDSIRNAIIEQGRIKYNDSLLRHYIDSISTAYRNAALTHFSDSLQNQLYDSLKWQNNGLVEAWNDSIVASVNDSIREILPVLERRARKAPLDVWLYNLSNDSILFRLRNDENYFTRMFIKNEQNDSLGVKVENINRNSMKILIDDGVTFTRFHEQQKRNVKFENYAPKRNLAKIENKYNVITPWTLGGSSSLGFTQTSLSNWKKGGNSSFSMLAILKGFANYSYNKIKWENSIEMRNGWVRLNDTDSDAKVQKNDDKLEIISQFGINAFNSKKWYYSAEIDFETQFFNGYNYDKDTENPISAFLSPSKTLIKFGFDYNPNKNFSLVLSPLTSKTVFVRDTAKIDQTGYGIDEDKRRLWDPGLNADLKYKKEIMDNVTWSTKYKMFVNYRSPFKKFDIDWENQISMKVNNYINVNFMLYLLYDDNVTFATNKTDAEGNTIYKPKWQIKELITVGFSYSLNKKLYRRKRIER